MTFLFVLCLFQCDGFYRLFTQIFVLVFVLDLTTMVQEKCVLYADDMFENVNAVTFHLLLINTVYRVPYAAPQQHCIVKYMQDHFTD